MSDFPVLQVGESGNLGNDLMGKLALTQSTSLPSIDSEIPSIVVKFSTWY